MATRCVVELLFEVELMFRSPTTPLGSIVVLALCEVRVAVDEKLWSAF
jgi:hypothetical protein